MPRRILAGFPQNARNELVRLRRGSPGHDSGPLGWLLFRCRTAPGQHLLPIWRKLGTRKSRLETKTENEAFSALLARLWCHLILENPANRAENLICLCSATIGQTGWRMVQVGAIFPDSDSSLYWTVCGVIFVSSVKLRWMNSRFGQFEFRYSPSPQARSRRSIASVAADSAYDKEAVYEAIEAHSPGRRTRVVIPPQRNATLSQNSNTAMRERDRHIRAIERHGRREWYKLSGCTERSMVENAVYRYKAIMGPEMRARTLARQRVEHRIGCEILNKMTALGMPDTYCAG